MRRVPPVPISTALRDPKAYLFGHEFYDNVPTDAEIKSFLEESGWVSRFETKNGLTVKDGKDVNFTATTSLVEGGVDRAVWKKVFEREPLPSLFPELAKPANPKK